MSGTDVYRTTGPNVSISNDDEELAADLVDVVDSLPTLSRDDLRDEWERNHPSTATFSNERDGSYFLEKEYRPAALDLPGFGEPYDGSEDRTPCGMEIPHVCDGCGRRIDVGSTCRRSTCRRCAPKWVLKTAPGIVNRIHSAAKMKPGSQKLHHVAASPPPEFFVDAENPEQEAISMLQEFMDAVDMDGIIVYHPYRGENESDSHIKSQDEDDRGEWKKRLFADRDWEGDVRDELDHSPHFHIVGCAEWFPGGQVTKTIEEETGWIFSRITPRGSSRSINGVHGLARAVTYALSHAGIDTRDDGAGGEQNRYVHGKKGSAYHGADDRHLQQAKEAVYHVAPETLGIPRMEISCRNKLPTTEGDDDHVHELDDVDGDGDVEEGSDETSTETPTETCHGDLTNIDKAEFVDEEDWQQSALHAEEAVETRRKWEEVGGWRGWKDRDQVRLEELEDNPPPD